MKYTFNKDNFYIDNASYETRRSCYYISNIWGTGMIEIEKSTHYCSPMEYGYGGYPCPIDLVIPEDNETLLNIQRKPFAQALICWIKSSGNSEYEKTIEEYEKTIEKLTLRTMFRQ